MNQTAKALPRPHSTGAWLLAIRPKTLPVGAAPIFVGVAIAKHAAPALLEWSIALLCLVTALLLQILSNLANDYFDFQKGADSEQRQGPVRALQQGLISPGPMKMALVAVSLAALASGGVLVWHGGWPYAVLGILAVISAIAYTGGPFPLGYHGLGDLFVFLFFGLAAVAGTTHLCSGSLPVEVWPAACAMGLLAVNLLVVNNVRDESEDRRHGKKTLVARWGKNFGVGQYVVGLFMAYLCVGAISSLTGNHWVLLTGAIAPIGINNLKRLVVQQGQELNQVLARTALFTFLFGGILSLTLIITAP